jgi:hypothetical protein
MYLIFYKMKNGTIGSFPYSFSFKKDWELIRLQRIHNF